MKHHFFHTNGFHLKGGGIKCLSIVFMLIYIGFTNTVHAQNFIPVCKAVPADGVSGDSFGRSVDVDGDYAVIGAYGYSSNAGKSYVLYNNGNTWEIVATLSASDAEQADHFGFSVSISGDNIVIGAYKCDAGATDCGAAYVFTKPKEGWSDMTQTAKLTADDADDTDYFGFAVSISGDYIAIGAYLDDDNGVSSGSTYVFAKPKGGWQDMSQTTKLIAPDGAKNDYYGCSVSMSTTDLVVGAYGHEGRGVASGAAYVYTKTTGNWNSPIMKAELVASDGYLGDAFGVSVSVEDEHIVVGAYRSDDEGANFGSAYVYVKPKNGWSNATETAKLIASDGKSYDYFGYSVDISGDDIIVGAYLDDDTGTDSGSAYVFTKPESGWVDMTETVKTTTLQGAEDDYCGRSVSVFNGVFFVGSYRDDDKGIDSGSAYVFTNKLVLSSIVRQSPLNEYTQNSSLVFRVSFSDEVLNVDATDFITSGLCVCEISNVAAVNTHTYDITICSDDLKSCNGAVGLNITTTTDIAAVNGGGLFLTESAIDEEYVVDHLAPIATLNSSATSSVSGDYKVTIVFNEEVRGFEVSDLIVTNGSVNGALISSDHISYEALITPTIHGDLGISIGVSAVQDLAGNDNDVVECLNLVLDTTKTLVNTKNDLLSN